MPENRDDRMMLTLDELRRDVERTPLADSLTVRRRGDQRTRRQAVGGALAVVALVAGAAGIYGGLDGGKRATQIPASPTPTAEQTIAVSDDPLLKVADIGTVGSYQGWQANPDPVPDDLRPSQCIPSPNNLGPEVYSRMLYSDSDAQVVEHIVRFADADAAQVGLGGLVQAFEGCDQGDPAEVTVVDRQPKNVAGVTGAETAVHASRTGTPVQASEISYYELGLVREGNVVVVLQWHSMGQPTGVDWVWDANRMASALDRAVK
jgi:hypothetical protein